MEDKQRCLTIDGDVEQRGWLGLCPWVVPFDQTAIGAGVWQSHRVDPELAQPAVAGPAEAAGSDADPRIVQLNGDLQLIEHSEPPKSHRRVVLCELKWSRELEEEKVDYKREGPMEGTSIGK